MLDRLNSVLYNISTRMITNDLQLAEGSRTDMRLIGTRKIADTLEGIYFVVYYVRPLLYMAAF